MIDRYMLRYFLAVAETGNFSRAARIVAVTQPTLSAGIAKLERQLGARLFDRDKRRVALTPAGARFLARARRIAEEYDLALQELGHAPQPRVLRVGVLSTIPTATIEALLTRHHESGGDETLEMLEGSERDLAERLDRGRLDLALGAVRPHHGRFRPEPLASERYLMVLPHEHPLATAPLLDPEQLASDPMVLRRHCEALPEINRFFTARGVRPRFVLKTTSDERALAVIRAGLGVGMMPECFADARIRMVPVRDFQLARTIGLLHAPGLDPATLADSPFVALVRAAYAEA
ncbi:MAG: LysR family transcriptional regulator [Sphingomonadales bacterium]|nr:LysR family transcriptional regulator [Sphingomonadales bacterium]